MLGTRHARPLVRRLATSNRRLQTPKPPRPPVTKVTPPPDAVKEIVKEHNIQQVKKKFSLTGFLFKTALAVTVAYGSTLYVATKNDKVMDFVIDKQLPYHEELIDLIENASIDDLKRNWQDLIGTFNKENIDQLATQLEKTSEHLIEETKKKFSKEKHATPAEQLQKPVEIEPVTEVFEKLPMLKLDKGLIDETVQATLSSFNELIALVDASAVGPKKDLLIKKINESLDAVSSKLNALNSSFEKELASKMKSSRTDLLTEFTQKELDLTKDMLEQYNYEKGQLAKKYESRLAKEVEAAQQALSQAAINATSMVRVEQTKRFEKLIKDKIDSERNGRLLNLDAVNKRLEELELYAATLESQVSTVASKSAVLNALTKLKSLLLNTTATTPATALGPYVESLEKSAAKTNDEVIHLALAELKPILSSESSQLILTVPQLQTAWEQLSPELRSSALLPPNAGLLGHFASILFSKLLLPVRGGKPDGKDIESVISRVQLSLSRGELDVAVEEVVNLKGWTRRLADDWVREGRKRLEADFLISLLDTEAKIL